MNRMTSEEVLAALAVDEGNGLLRAVNELLTRYEETAEAEAADEAQETRVRLGALTRKDACRHVRESLHQWRSEAMAKSIGQERG
jgi:hypothetical protein